MYQAVIENMARVIEDTPIADKRGAKALSYNPSMILDDDESQAMGFRQFVFDPEPRLLPEWRFEDSAQAPSMVAYEVGLGVVYPVANPRENLGWTTGAAMDDSLAISRQIALFAAARFNSNPVTDFSYGGCRVEHEGLETVHGEIVSMFTLQVRFIPSH